MNGEQLSIKWSNFQSTIIAAFESLQSTEDLTDVTLTCEGLNVKAHKVILSACSPYFRTVFRENPCPHPIVILKDVLYTDMLAILKFMYHGEVLLHKDHLSTFLQTAEILQVSGLIGHGDLSRIPECNVSNSTQYSMPRPAKNARPQENLLGSPQKKPKVVQKARRQIEELPEAEVIYGVAMKPEVASNDAGERNENNNHVVEQSGGGSLLEAALDNHLSILERSLKSVGKPPVPALAPKPDHSTIPARKPPEGAIFNTLPINATSTTSAAAITLGPPQPTTVLIKTEQHDDIDDDRALDGGDHGEDALDEDEDEHDQLEIDVTPGHLVETVVAATCEDELYSVQTDSLSKANIVALQAAAAAAAAAAAQAASSAAHHSSQCGNCPHCGKTYSNQSALKYHVRLVHSDMLNLYCCHLCPLTFDYREGYKKHMVEVHSFRN